MDTINVLVVDDQDLVRTAISRMLSDAKGIKVVGEAECGKKALELTQKLSPQVVLLDLRLPDIDGLEVTREVLHLKPKTKVLILTAYNDDIYPSRLLHAGASGYLTKDASAEELMHAIQHVAKGECYISPSLAQKLILKGMGDITGGDVFEQLSDRELEVAIMIAQGNKAPEIAKKLRLSDKTINSFRYRIFKKLQVNGDIELALLAIRHGLVPVIRPLTV